jgi:acyl dehydratase
MFDKSKIGHNFPSFTYEVQRNKIHELTTAIGDPNPIYHSREEAQRVGYADVPISPTSPTLFSFWGQPERGTHMAELGIDVARILHGEEEYEYLAPIYPNDVLTGTTTLVDGKTRQSNNGKSMDILTLVTHYVNQHNQPVLNVKTIIIVR